jgi:dephospho-CoA kinase
MSRAAARTFFSIGLTGGIASGKSSARKMMGEIHGARIIDADRLGHACYEKSHPCLNEVLDAFGRDNLLTDGQLDRAKLGGIVFSDSSQLAKLNNIVWPHIRAALSTQLQAIKTEVKDDTSNTNAASTTIVVVEAAVLLEASWEDLFDEVWVVYVDPEIACQRLMERNNFSLEEAQKRQKSQISNQARLSKCHIKMSNNGTFNDLQRCLQKEYSKLKIRASGLGLNAEEMLTVVDKNTNKVIGAAKRSIVKASSDMCYRATYIFVRQVGSEKLYVQRRSDLKDYCPGELDPVFGGCVGEGETYEENAVRELKEELGVESPLHHLFTFLFDGDESSSPIWGDVWETEINIPIEDLQLQPEEVDAVFLMTPEDIIALDEARSDSTPAEKRVTRDSAVALKMYVDRRNAVQQQQEDEDADEEEADDTCRQKKRSKY